MPRVRRGSQGDGLFLVGEAIMYRDFVVSLFAKVNSFLCARRVKVCGWWCDATGVTTTLGTTLLAGVVLGAQK